MGGAPSINGRIAAALGAAPLGDVERSTLGREGTMWPAGGPAMTGRDQAPPWWMREAPAINGRMATAPGTATLEEIERRRSTRTTIWRERGARHGVGGTAPDADGEVNRPRGAVMARAHTLAS